MTFGADDDRGHAAATLSGVQLHPRASEATFWRSAYAQTVCLSLDTWAFSVSFFVYPAVGALTHQHDRSSSTMVSPPTIHAIIWALLVVHFMMLLQRPRTYLRYRHLLVFLLRSLRILQGSLLYVNLGWNGDTLLSAQLPSWVSLVYLSAPHVLVSCLTTLLHPLPWHPQLFLVTAKLLLDLLYGVPAISCMLQQPGSDMMATAQRACRGILGGIMRASQPFMPVDLPRDMATLCSGSSSSASLLIFLFGFLGAALPLHISYACEQRIKMRYLRGQEEGQRQGEGEGGEARRLGRVLSVPEVCVWLFLAAVVCCLAAKFLTQHEWYDARHCGGQPGG